MSNFGRGMIFTKSEIKAILIRPPIKAIIIAILTTIISIFVSALGNWDKEQAFFGLKVVGFFVFTISYVILIGWYAVVEVNNRRITEELQHRVDAFRQLVVSIITICETNATDINTCLHRLYKENTIDRELWNFRKSSKVLCEQIYNNIRHMGGSDNYAVAYVMLDESDPAEDKVQMIAYSNQAKHTPTIYGKLRQFKNIILDNAYHDLRLFAEARSDTDIRMGIEEVAKAFAYSSPERAAQNREKYYLYIGIPVFCDNRKMIGLLEVMGFDNTYLGCLNKSELEDMTNKFLVPYAHIFLLLHKMEKALLAGTSAQ